MRTPGQPVGGLWEREDADGSNEGGQGEEEGQLPPPREEGSRGGFRKEKLGEKKEEDRGGSGSRRRGKKDEREVGVEE